MRILPVTINNFSKVHFGDALSTKQEKDFNILMDKIEQKEREERHSRGDYLEPLKAAIVHPFAFPSRPDSFDDGVGKVNSPMAKRYYEIMKTYGGAKAIQFLPLTQMTDVGVYNQNHSASPYQGAGLALNEAIIYIPNLMGEEYGCLLTKNEVLDYTSKHKENVHQQIDAIKSKYTNNKIESDALIDIQTPLGWKNQEDYPINEPLRIAYHRLLNEENKNPKVVQLRKEFNEFKNQKEPIDYDMIYTRLALFPYMKDWANATVSFFNGFDSNKMVREEQIDEIEKWYRHQSVEQKKNIIEAIDFYKFKQFIARKELKAAIDTIHKLGMEAYGDVLWGNSWVEQQMFPDAFLKREDGVRGQIGDLGGLPAYNFEDLRDKPNSAARKFLEQKIGFNLDFFDGLRLDMGWEYIRPKYNFGGYDYRTIEVGTEITDFIAKCAKKYKGNDFDTRKLMYECDANGADFSIYQYANLMKQTQGTMILTTAEEKEEDGGFGSVPFYRENLGFDDDKMLIGTNNHDKRGVMEIADNFEDCKRHVGALLRAYKKRPEDGVEGGWKSFKSDMDSYENLKLFTKAKFAEAELAKNNFIYYLNLLGRREKLDYHTDGSIAGGYDSAVDYKNRLQRKSEEWFHDALRAEVAYNRAAIKLYNIDNANKNPDGTQKVFYGELYNELQKYAAYLKRNTGISTREQADNSENGKLNISEMTLEEIENQG